jgi:serine/threonine protein kinase/Tfp pilus assembly protein PilF
MNPELWKRIDEIFHAALNHQPSERSAYLAEVCEGNDLLRAEIEGLLASHEKERSLFESSPATLAAEVLANQAEYKGSIAHYTILEKIGSGGMGEVYLALDTRLNRKVALKLLPQEFTKDKERIRRFEREARAVTALNHPYILTIYDIGQFEYSTFIASEFVDGQTLRQKMRLSKIPLKEILTIVIQVTEALDAAHRAGIIHRDIKPENIMLREDGYVKVLDFGLSKPIENSADVSQLDTNPLSDTQTGIVIGTIRYMSPEQARGLKVDTRTDIFSIGIVLYEMITHRLPFEGPTSTDVLAAILEKQPPALSSIGNFPEGLQWIINKALAKNEEERYQTAKDLITDLKRIRKHLEIGEETTESKSFALAGRKKLIAASSILLLIVLLASFYYFHQTSRTSTPPPNLMAQGMRPSIAVIGFKNLSGASDTTWISSALSEMLSTELAIGEKLLVVSGEEVSRSKKELSLEQMDSFSKETLLRIRKNLPADYLVLGAYYVPEGQKQIRLDLNLQKTEDGKIAARFSETRNELDLLGLVLTAGLHLRQSLGIVPLSQQQINSARTSLSSNAEAVRFYSQGLAQLREMDRRGARDLMLKAVKEDPKFPLAYSVLSQAWFELGYTKNALDAAKSALNFSDSLSREERLLIEARYAQASGNWQSAIQSYQSLFTFFPDNLEYGLLLADLQKRTGFLSDANETIKLLRRLPSPINEDPRIDLAELFISEIFDPERYLKMAETAVEKARLRGAALLEARALLDKGTVLWNMSQKKEAITAFETARQIYKSHGRKGDLLVVEDRISAVLRDSGDFDNALKSEQEQLQKYRQLDEKHNVALNYLSVGQIQSFLGKTDDALKSYTAAQEILEEIDNRPNLGYLFGRIARLYYRRGELTKAEKYYFKAIDFLKDSPRDLQWVLISLASTKKAMGDKAKARQYYEQVLTINRNLKSKAGTAATLADIALLNNSNEDFRIATEYLEQLSRDYHRDRNALGQLFALNKLEELYQAQNDVTKTTKVIREKLPLIRTLRDSDRRMTELQSSAWRFLDLGFFKEAETLAQEILNFAKTTPEFASSGLFILRNAQWLTGDVTKLKTTLEELKKDRPKITWSEKAYVLEREAMLNFECGNLPQAQKQFEEVLKQAVTTKDFELKFSTTLHLTKLAAERAEHPKAEQLFQQALKMAKEAGSESSITTYHDHLGKYFFKRGNFIAAEKEWNQVIEHLKKENLPREEKISLARIADCRILQKDFDKAAQILKSIDETDTQVRENFWDVTEIRQAKARLLSSQNKYDEAIQLLNPIIKKAGQENLTRVLLETNSILAEIKIESGKKAEGTSLLNSVEKEARKYGYINIAHKAARLAKTLN